MNVKGSHEFQVSREQLWAYLMDPEVLAKITPGVTRLEILDTDTYQSVSDIKLGPVKGTFKGKLKVEEKNEPATFAIKMEQLSKIGNAHATVHMVLDEKGDNSVLNFNGKAKLSGVIARTGQRVLTGVANTLTKEVFASLEKHIEQDTGNKTSDAKVVEDAPLRPLADTPIIPATPAGETPILKEISRDNTAVETTNVMETASKKSTGLWAFLKRLFGFGD